MEFLKEVLGEDLYSQINEKVNTYNKDNKDKPIKIVNLSEGNYVSKDKFVAKEKEVTTLNEQLSNANNEIKSYKDMDIDSIKQSASDWETKYNELVETQKAEKEQSIKNERINEFFKDVKFSSEMAKKGIIAEFNKKDFKYDEETKSFQGANEWLNNLKEQDKGSFLSDVANPKFTTVPKAPTESGFNETKDEIRLNPMFKNYN